MILVLKNISIIKHYICIIKNDIIWYCKKLYLYYKKYISIIKKMILL